jgi:hypothetical protein
VAEVPAEGAPAVLRECRAPLGCGAVQCTNAIGDWPVSCGGVGVAVGRLSAPNTRHRDSTRSGRGGARFVPGRPVAQEEEEEEGSARCGGGEAAAQGDAAAVICRVVASWPPPPTRLVACVLHAQAAAPAEGAAAAPLEAEDDLDLDLGMKKKKVSFGACNARHCVPHPGSGALACLSAV